ncbi:hypothetical protein DID88_003045 [Monilinia fructigena]|uniref:Uncharacterized protein n=1 Tax=Monilinia fructigena TaxID=38457 RepID=A0A395IK16_9HELO|nr:hypothetical protein DID88_003045 [Monilinia fructigena]
MLQRETIAAVRGIGPPKMLLPPSLEQRIAIDTLLHTKKNVIVDSCAGFWKNDNNSAPGKICTRNLIPCVGLQPTLDAGDKKRVQDLALDNVTVQNCHTLGTGYYTSECATDQGLKRAVEDYMPVLDGMELPEFSVLILDEQQDVTPILKRFVDKVILDKGFTGPDVGLGQGSI